MQNPIEKTSPLPLAYQTGLKDFYGRDFIVSPDVLIPRPETEQIIDLAITLAGLPILPGIKPEPPRLPTRPKILDVGTGSGCIALTLALTLPASTVLATDISKKALKIAEKNTKKFSVKNITFLHSDLCKSLISSADKISENPRLSNHPSNRPSRPTLTPPFDLITANLPYVDPSWPWLDKFTLSTEPALALYAKDSGLALIFSLLAQISTHHLLAPSGFLIIEADPCQHQKILDYALNLGFSHEKTSGFALLFRLSLL